MPLSRQPRLLLIEPDDIWRIQLRHAASHTLIVDTCADYRSALRQFVRPYTWIVTNIRLAEYNGLQLVYLARDAHPGCHAIAYTESRDIWLAREAQRAGAFYETRECLPVTLPVWLTAQLPAADRRDPARPDRRSSARAGGRRAWDRHRASEHGVR
jgi:DNA-binding NtrC family response regulator